MLKAGFSRLDVTPPLKSFVSGYFIKRYAKGVLEPILLNALALSDGNTTSIIIAAALLGIRQSYCDEILSLISERTGIPTDIVCRKELLFNKTRTDGEERYEECVKILSDPENRKADGSKIELLGNASRIVGLRNQPIYQKLPLSSVIFGKIGIVGVGGKPFTRYAVRICENLPDRFIITLACANGMEGYLPIKEAFTEGGYEAGASPFSPCLEDDCIEASLKLLKVNG